MFLILILYLQNMHTKKFYLQWGRMLRDIYVHRDTQLFQSVQQFSDIISEQIGIRASLICGKLPREEVRDLRTKLTKKMDYLNHHLQLDLVVRDKDGNILDPDKTSAVSLFREHKLSNDNRSRNLLHSSGPRSDSYMLLLSDPARRESQGAGERHDEHAGGQQERTGGEEADHRQEDGVPRAHPPQRRQERFLREHLLRQAVAAQQDRLQERGSGGGGHGRGEVFLMRRGHQDTQSE